MMNVILTGGGTGGHIYPALALAKEIRSRHPEAKILYIGSERGLEKEIVRKAGYEFRAIDVSGFKRKLSLDNVKTVVKFLRGVFVAKKWIRDFHPDVVVGTGGYVCGPVVYAAARLGIPTLIHEQNVIPGLTNKFLARFVDKVAVSFPASSAYFPQGKVVVTGNPRATEVAHADRRKGMESLRLPAGKKVVLIVGGSRGARPINEAFLQMVPLLGKAHGLYFVYVTGEAHFQTVMEAIGPYRASLANVSIYPFLYNMPEVLAATDLIVNRAGASFLAEITSLGIPSILIPSPYVTNNHQEKNARWMEENGASVMILEKDLRGDLLFAKIMEILGDREKWEGMRQAAKRLGHPDAAARMYGEIMRILS
ncbi:undecaprenyldiphospho-muramoylpentapeptide beta-N-acetylglucosaminyltransferase [Bacillaceae bacterium]